MNDTATIDGLIRSVWGFIKKTASKLCGNTHSMRQKNYEDLVAAGLQGAWESARKFDPSKGFEFLSFAHLRIRGAMVDWIRSTGGLNRKGKAKQNATPELLLSDVTKAIESRLAHRSGDELISDELAIAKTVRSQMDDNDWFRTVIRSIPDQHAWVVKLYYRDGMTMRGIGKAIGLSESRVSQVHAEALQFLRERFQTCEELV